MMMEHIGTWDGTTFQLPSPAPAPATDDADLIERVVEAAREIAERGESLTHGYKEFTRNLADLTAPDSESSSSSSSSSYSSSPSPSKSLTSTSQSPSSVPQSSELEALSQKRAALTRQLASLNEQIATKRIKRDEAYEKIRASGGSVGGSGDPEEMVKMIDVAAITAKNLEVEKEIEELKGTEAWYTAVKAAMGMLSGVEILETKALDKKTLQITLALELFEREKLAKEGGAKASKAAAASPADAGYQLKLTITDGRVSGAEIFGVAPLAAPASSLSRGKAYTCEIPGLEVRDG